MAADPYKYFRIEAQEILEQLGQGALDLEKGIPSGELIGLLLRLAHTLKGAARVVKQPEIAEHAHVLEDLFGALRDSSAAAPRGQIDVVLALLDKIGQRISKLGSPAEGTTDATRVQSAEPVHTFRPEAADMEALGHGVADAQAHLGRLRPTLAQTERIHRLLELVGDQLTRSRPRDTASSGDRPAVEKALSLIEELRGRVGALERDLASGVDHIDRELRQVGDAAARLRLVPTGAMFRFLERAVRDTAQAVGNEVVFESRGGDVRVDGAMLVMVQSALLQLVRNAVAHGIEPADDRRAAGKAPEGRVTLAVWRRGSAVAFVCSDDGRGIDVAAVRDRLRRKGHSPAAGDTDTDDLLRLLLTGGISTSGSVTEVAGRGVGLDVARAAAERLGGEVSIRTEPHAGTTVELVVPFSIASFQALFVDVAGVPAAVPLDAVRRTLRLAPEEIIETAQGQSILDDARSIPFWRLAGVIHPARPAQPAGTCPAFVVETADGAAAFGVDRILGTGTITMRPLPELAPAVAAVAGASLDMGGAPRLVLDPAGLIAEAQRRGRPEPTAAAARRAILVVDDSLTTRMLEQSILESAGYDVTLAGSGEEGLQKARDRAYSLFLVDVEMPGMDGFTFIERARQDPELRGIPSMLITSRASAEDRQRGRDVGAYGYIVKSEFDQGVLLERIRTLVG